MLQIRFELISGRNRNRIRKTNASAKKPLASGVRAVRDGTQSRIKKVQSTVKDFCCQEKYTCQWYSKIKEA
jgi:hypothetical protein